MVKDIILLFSYLKFSTKLKFSTLLLSSMVQALMEIAFIVAVTLILIGKNDNAVQMFNNYILSLSFSNQLFVLFIITTLLATLKSLNLIYMKKLSVSASGDIVSVMMDRMFRYSAQQFVSLNRDDVVTNFTNRLTTVTFGYFFPLLNTVSAFVSILFIFAYTAAFDWKILTGIFIVILFYVIVTLFTQQHRNKIGDRISSLLSLMNERVLESLEFYREIRVNGRSEEYKSLITETNSKFRGAVGDLAILATFPRYILEVIVIGFCFVYVYLHTFFEMGNLDEVKAALVVFFTASTRLIPSAQAFYSGYNTMSVNSHQLSTLAKSVPYREKHFNGVKKSTSSNYLIKLKDVDLYSYDNKKKILENFNFEFPKNGFWGVVGPSGSGKSTLIDSLLGLSDFSHGEYFIRTGVRFVFSQQTSQIKNSSLRDNLTLYAKEPPNEALLINYSEAIGLLDESISLDSAIKRENLSGGQIKKISFLRALIADADVYIFDEPTAGIDGMSAQQMLSLMTLKSITKTIICVTHDPILVKAFDGKISLR